jgi:hypothetical protein
MGICLCLREARTSENGPPPLAPAPAASPPPRAVARRPARRRSARGASAARAGRGGLEPKPERVSVPRGLGTQRRRQGPAAAHSRPTTRRPDRTDDRACTDARPRLQPPVPTPDSSPALPPPPSASHRCSTHPSQIRHQPTRHARPARCRRPAPGPPAPAWANPHHIYLARRGRGVRREAADPPSSLSPGGKPRKQPGAGPRPVALRGETHRAKQMERNTRRETAAVVCLRVE